MIKLQKKLKEKGQKKLKKTVDFVKRKPRTSAFMSVLFFIAIFIWYGLQPIRGSMYYGVCRVFTQMQLRYPDTMEVVSADVFSAEWRVYYTFIDAFGSERSEMVKCIFGPSQKTGFKIEEAQLLRGTKRTEFDQKTLDKFNATIPAIIAGEPNLILPWKPGETLRDLKKK